MQASEAIKQLNRSREMFSNPAGLAAAGRACSSGASGVQTYGESIWDAMCFMHEGFRLEDITLHVKRDWPEITISTISQYIRAFTLYARACPETFTGQASRLTKSGKGCWYLADADE